MRDLFGYQGHAQDQPPEHNNDINFQMMQKAPSEIGGEAKDPLKWDPPTPKLE